MLTIVDAFSRFSPVVDPRFSYRGEDEALTLERICKSVGYPKTIRAPSSSRAILICGPITRASCSTSQRPGKPTENAFIESFNSQFRAECLNAHRFMSLTTPGRKSRCGLESITRSGRIARSPISPDNADKRLCGACRVMNQNSRNSSFGWPKNGALFKAGSLSIG